MGKKSLLLLWVCLSCLQVNGQFFKIDTLSQHYPLSDEIYLLEGSPAYSSWDEAWMAAEQGRFRPYLSYIQPLEAEQAYWGLLRLRNALPGENDNASWILRFSIVLTDIEFYIIENGRLLETQYSGYFRPFYDKAFAPRAQPNLLRLTLPPGQERAILLKAKSERPALPPRFEVEMVPERAFWPDLIQEKQRDALFTGFILMMLVYNVILSFFFNDRSHVLYSSYLVAITAYFLYASGWLIDILMPWLFPEHPKYTYLFKLVAYGGLVSYMGFIRAFLDLHKLLPAWDRIFQILIWLALPVALIDALLMGVSNFNPNVADMATIPYTLAFIFATFIFIWPLYKTRDKKSLFILVGIISMGMGILMTVLERLKAIDFSMSYFKFGAALEVVVFSLGLAYRRREEAKERQRSKFELEKSQLLQQQEHAEAERLKELAELKSMLYTNITHEFRTPLTVIMGMASQVEGNINARNIILRNSENLIRLINQMLDLSKLESGKLQLSLIQGNIIAHLQYITESFHSLAFTKQIQLSFHSEEKELWMDFDEEKIQHIAYNLLANAIKFTPDKGKASLHVKKEEAEGRVFLKIIVADNGIGISKEELPHIFKRFYQVNPNEGKVYRKGSGIGLSITRELVELMKGSIRVESEKGKGARFIVRLPVSRNAEIGGSWPDTPPGLQAPVPEAAPAVQDEEKPQVLVVEDNPDVVTYIRSCLEAGYLIHTAGNGNEGIEAAIEVVPDIIISDIMMPEVDGYELCHRLKEDERTSHIPIILLTALAEKEDELAGYRQGADAYLTKPFGKEELLLRMEKLIEARQRLQEYFTKGIHAEEGEKGAARQVEVENAFLLKLRQVVENNISDQEFSVSTLCKAALLSHTQVYRKVKALTNKTPSQFIRSIRLEKALQLLHSTNENVSEIAYRVGFNDPNYFSRSFQQEFGYPPSSVRRAG